MSGAREENRSRAAMWVTVRPRISWWTALTVFLLLHSGEEKDFSPFLSPPRTFPLTHPTEMQRHKPGPAIPQPDFKKMEQPFEKKSHAPGAYSEAGPVSGPSQESIPDGGSGFFLKKRGPASRRTSWIQAMIFAETA